MKLPPKWYPLVVFSAALLVSLDGANRVVVKADATQDFLQARALDESKEIQTYQFMKGRYFPGSVRRLTMENFAFTELLESLAVHLRRQGFYPDKENGEGDLVIVVHYGVTDFTQNIMEDLGYTSMADMGFMNAEEQEFGLHSHEWSENSRASSDAVKASLLGVESAYDWRRDFDDHKLQVMVEKARYFVVLIAYDLPLAKQGILQPHWMTRYSIRATGQSYDQAVIAMNEVAGNYFGKDLDELQNDFPDYESKVEIGEIEVIEEEKDD